MEPKWNQTSIKMGKMQITPENFVSKPWYREVGTKTEVLEPIPWIQELTLQYQKISTVPTLVSCQF